MPEIYLLRLAAASDFETRRFAEVLCDTYNWGLCLTVSLLKLVKEFSESQRAVVDHPTGPIERNNLNQGLRLQVMHLDTHRVFGPAPQVLSLNSIGFNIGEFIAVA